MNGIPEVQTCEGAQSVNPIIGIEEKRKKNQEERRKYRSQNKEKIYEYKKEWRINNADKVQQQKLRWQGLHRDKHLAHRKLVSRVGRKSIIKPVNCQMCNVLCRVESHHEDYTKPFDVVWVCRACHMKIHYGENNNYQPHERRP